MHHTLFLTEGEILSTVDDGIYIVKPTRVDVPVTVVPSQTNGSNYSYIRSLSNGPITNTGPLREPSRTASLVCYANHMN
jgi:hypothetical protein